MKKAVQKIEILIFELDGGIPYPKTVSDILSRYNLIPDRLGEAFDSLTKTAGNETVSYKNKIIDSFLQECIDNEYGEL